MLAEKEDIQGAQALAPPQGISRFAPSMYQVGLIAILGAIFIVSVAPRLDTDLWIHLQTGKYIFEHHVVPSRDFMSFTAAGQPWTVHEWLTQLMMYSLYRIGGLWGPLIVFAVLITLTFWLVYTAMTQRGVNRVLALFIVTAAFMAASPAIGARPQMITLLFLAVYAQILLRYQQTRSRKLLILFPAIMLLWANMHGGFALGILLLGLTLVGETLNSITRQENALTRDELRALALTLAGTIAITVINPNGIREVLYPLVWIFPTAYANSLTEWVSTDFHMPQFMVFEAMLLLLIAALFIGRPRLNWTYLILIVVFTHLGLSQVRNVSVWTILISPLVALYLQQTIPALKELFPGRTYRRRPVRGSLAPILNLVFLALVAIAYVGEASHYVNAAGLRQNETTVFPERAVGYLDTHALPSHVFADYAWGGYVLWKLYPRYQDFIDGRANTLFSSALLGSYFNAYGAAPNWKSVLKRYDVGTVLVDRGAPLAQVLAEDHGWKLRYSDQQTAVYSRR